MTWFSAFAVFFIVWWTVLFAMLPFGLKTQDDADDVTLGTVSSAPRGPHMLKVVIRTTIVVDRALRDLLRADKRARLRLRRPAAHRPGSRVKGITLSRQHNIIAVSELASGVTSGKVHQNPDCTKKMQGTRPCKETRPI